MRKPMRIALLSTIVVVVVLAVGNLTIFAASLWARGASSAASASLPGIGNVRVLDHKVLRGAQPDAEGYRSLARADIDTVIDLRAEENARAEEEPAVTALGMNYVHIPMRDGQAPTDEQVDAFLSAVRDADGRVFVHCGAGVGRTGTMAAAYLVATGQAEPSDALLANLEVGPPSLEQLSFVSSLDEGKIERPPALVVGLSRFLDAPRRILSRLSD